MKSAPLFSLSLFFSQVTAAALVALNETISVIAASLIRDIFKCAIINLKLIFAYLFIINVFSLGPRKIVNIYIYICTRCTRGLRFLDYPSFNNFIIVLES